ncbi:MAG: peptidoglycan synthetase FtsI [Frankiales bacterium]|nr:peptidoglycan synthetase FtsI [Frankiales bacterium]
MTPPQARRPTRKPVRARRRPLGRPGVRLRSGLVILGAVVMLLAGRLVQLQGLQPTASADQGVQRTQVITIPALRGAVLDRNGNPLAVSQLARNVYAEPTTIAKAVCQPTALLACTPAAIAAKVAPLLGLVTADVTTKLSSGRSFVYLKRGVDPALAQQVIDLRLPGIGQETTTVRTHPSGSLAAAVLGYTDIDGVGKAGIESAFNSVLAGTPGKTVARHDAYGRVIPTGTDSHVDPIDGKDVQLTIDQDLQWYAQDLLAKQVQATEAKNGTIVVMDVKTGEVLAFASAPTFDPDHVKAGDPVAMNGLPGIAQVYEPGSVNKVITAAAALQRGIVTPSTVIDVPSSLRVSNKVLHDAEKHGDEHLTFTGVLAKSSNIGTVKVAQQVGAQALYDTMRSFGFGSKSGIGLPADSRGLLPKPADWSGTSIANIPIGQGVSTTVLQVASVYATIANNGVRVQPSIVKAERDSAGHPIAVPAPPTRRVISTQVATEIRQMLESAVSEQGTAPLAAVAGYRVSGKTGTAQRVATDGSRSGYYDGTYTSSFVGMAPADAPRFVVAVVLQGTGKRGYFGGQVAAPLFSKVMGFALRSYAVPPTGTVAPRFQLVAP